MEELAADAGPQTPVGNVQVDSFCAHCNYNLFSQVVFRDKRLGILVCRCPECGRFTAAGNMTTASQKLAQRLATGGLVVYIGFMLAVLVMAVCLLWASQGSFLEDLYYNQLQQSHNVLWPELVGGAVVGLMLGGFFATFCWHWRRRWRFLSAIIPMLIAPLAWNSFRTMGYNAPPKPLFISWGWSVLAVVVGIQVASMLVAAVLGRPIARLALRVMLPARLLQYLSFLWIVDGKSVPTPRSVNASSSA